MIDIIKLAEGLKKISNTTAPKKTFTAESEALTPQRSVTTIDNRTNTNRTVSSSRPWSAAKIRIKGRAAYNKHVAAGGK